MDDELARAILSGSLALSGIALVLVVLLLGVYQGLFGPDNTPGQRRYVAIVVSLGLLLVTLASVVSLGSLAYLRALCTGEFLVWAFVVLVIAIPIISIISAVVTMRS